MKLVQNFARRFVLLTAVFALTNLGGFAQPVPGLAAHWEGAIQMPERELHITLDLAKNSKGEWTGSFSIPAEDIIDAPLTRISVKDTSVRFGLGLSNISFDGTLSRTAQDWQAQPRRRKGRRPFSSSGMARRT